MLMVPSFSKWSRVQARPSPSYVELNIDSTLSFDLNDDLVFFYVKSAHTPLKKSAPDFCRLPLTSYIFLWLECRGRLIMVPLPYLLLLLLALATPAQSQQSMTDYVYGGCNVNTYQSNSSFARNYNTVVSILKQRALEGSRYYLTSITDDPDNSSWVYGTFQCRGDLSTAENCSACLGAATGYGCTNGPAIGMRIQLLGCYYRYENYEFTSLDVDIWKSNCSSQKNTSTLYQADLSAAINTTARVAPNSSDHYAAATVGSAHALSECLGYLSPSDCFSCLSQSSSRYSICNTSSSGYFYYSSCYYLFSDTTLLLSNSSSAPSTVIDSPAPAPSNSPSGIPPPTSPPSVADLPGSPVTLSSKGSTSSSLSAAAIAGISVGSALVVLAAAIFCLACAAKRRRSVTPPDLVLKTAFNPSSQNPSNFTVEELQVATESFNSGNKLGQGGFGIVYKGTLRNGTDVAIKIISPGENRGKEIDFMNEAKLISTVQHRNLIQLLGWTTDDSRWYLVYEYLPNRSLDLHLFGSNDEVGGLDWKMRFNIISGIAKGLCYLHEDSHVRIVHRDIKTSNILLDANLEPKIADFGLARLFADDVSHLTTAVAGTLGYVAPEYAMGGQLSEKVDVYSFGLVTLEIVSGRRVIENDYDGGKLQAHILEWAWDMYERKQVLEMVDQRVMAAANEWEVARAVHVALLCTQTNPQARPSMSQVYTMLRSQSAILALPSRPAIMSMGIFSPSHYHQQQRHHAYNSSGTGTDNTSVTTSSTAASQQSVEEGRSRDVLGSWVSSASDVAKRAATGVDSSTDGPISEVYPR